MISLINHVSRLRSQWHRWYGFLNSLNLGHIATGLTKIGFMLACNSPNKKNGSMGENLPPPIRIRISSQQEQQGETTSLYYASLFNIFWLVVYLPLWNIWKSVGIIISNIYGKKCSKPPTRLYCSVDTSNWMVQRGEHEPMVTTGGPHLVPGLAV